MGWPVCGCTIPPPLRIAVEADAFNYVSSRSRQQRREIRTKRCSGMPDGSLEDGMRGAVQKLSDRLAAAHAAHPAADPEMAEVVRAVLSNMTGEMPGVSKGNLRSTINDKTRSTTAKELAAKKVSLLHAVAALGCKMVAALKAIETKIVAGSRSGIDKLPASFD